MARYELGQPLRISLPNGVRDIDGNLADPSDITLTIADPTGAQTTYDYSPGPIVRDSLGMFHLDYSPASVGHYRARWTTTGANAGAKTTEFDVYDGLAAEIISVDDAKDYLRKTSSFTGDDDQLERLVAAVTNMVENIIGPVGRRTVTETVYPSSGVLLLSTVPVLSLTSVTPYASAALDVSTLSFGATSGVIYPGVYGSFWARTYTVIYTAGRASVPADVSEAALIILNHLWSPQVGGTGGVQVGGTDTTGGEPFTGGFGFAIPNRAKELLAPYRLPAAVA